jgi:predicted DNA-binding transcriptional regulator YafY
MRTVLDAIERSETIVLAYRKPSARAAAERLVDPYLLHVHAGAVYLIGLSRDRGALRTFRVDRVREARLTGQRFTSRVPFSTSTLVQGALGPWEGKPRRVRLVFDPEAAHFVAERSMHPTQRSQWRSDGRLDVEMHVPVCPPLVTWVLGFGSAVAVLGPVELARHIAREHAHGVARTTAARTSRAA